jgi:broad specificity phosphatase PhoE
VDGREYDPAVEGPFFGRSVGCRPVVARLDSIIFDADGRSLSVFEIVLVRHGEPDWEPDGRGVDDPRLTALGVAQAEATAAILGGERFDAFHTSQLRRARETSRPIAERLGMQPQVQTWLAELGLPSLAGRTSADVERFFGAIRTRELKQWWDGVPGGESFRHFYERVGSGVEGLLLGDHRLRLHEEHSQRLWRIPDEDRRVLIVAHDGTNAVILAHLLGIDPVPWAWLRFASSFCGISRIRTTPVASGHVWVLVSFNRAHHTTGVRA